MGVKGMCRSTFATAIRVLQTMLQMVTSFSE